MRRTILLTVFAASAAVLGACTSSTGTNNTPNKPVNASTPVVTSSPAVTSSPVNGAPSGSPAASPSGSPSATASPNTKSSPGSAIMTPEKQKDKGDSKGMENKTATPTPKK